MKSSVLTFTPVKAEAATLQDSVLETQTYIDHKVQLIAPKFYQARQINPDEWKATHTKAGKKKRKRDPVLQQQKRDAMRAKFDPDAKPAFTSPINTLELPSKGSKRAGQHRDARMDALGSELGFVPGSAATHAELKARVGLVRSFYRGKRNLTPSKKKPKQPKKKRAKVAPNEGISEQVPAKLPSAKPPAAQEDSISFGAFTYQNGAPVPSYQAQKQRKRGISKDVDLLRKAEKRKAEQEALKQTEGGRKQLVVQEWEKMTELAAGGKLIKDDIKILKKKIKTKQKQKAKSKKQWNDRTETLKEEKRGKAARFAEGKKKTVARKREKRLKRTGFGTKKQHINKKAKVAK